MRSYAAPAQGYKSYGSDYGEKRGIAGIGRGSAYGDRTADINKDQVYDRDLTRGSGDKRNGYDGDDFGDINKDRVYDYDNKVNRRDEGGFSKERGYDRDETAEFGGKGDLSQARGYGVQGYGAHGQHG